MAFPVTTVSCLLAEGAAGPDMWSMLFPLVAIGVLFYFMLIRPQRREQAKHQSLLDNIKKNDRVLTIGGIYGVVTNVNREGNEVTVKVDETTNTRLRMTLGSIAKVIVDAPSGDQPSN
jgi:preprotein translocase subunit YajC